MGVVTRVLKGVYVEAGVPDDLDLRIAALRLHAPPDTVVCDRHAAWLHGAEMVLAPGEHLEAMPVRMMRRRGSASLRNPVSVRGERDLRDDEIVEMQGLAVTTPLRTCADLGMVRWPSESLAGMNAIYRTGLVDKERLLALSAGFKGRRWVTTFRAVAPLVHDLCESPAEDVLWLRCHEAGLDLQPQVELWDGSDFVARFDLADPDLKFAVEYDGADWHSTPEQLARDRRRRDRARALGWTIVVIRSEDLFAQTLRAEELVRAGHRAARARADVATYVP
jgi:very-short-patch-repair endonuclease